jgi:hypothetical protein
MDEFGNFERTMLQWMADEPGVHWMPVYRTHTLVKTKSKPMPDILQRASDLVEKSFMPWCGAERQALSEFGIDDAAIEDLRGNCTSSTVLVEDDVSDLVRSVLVHGNGLVKSVQPKDKPLTDSQMWSLWNARGSDEMSQQEAIAFAHSIEAAHGIQHLPDDDTEGGAL